MLPTNAKSRKDAPVARGLLDYFPDACVAVAELSRIGNEQHNPGEPMHWAREKSTDHADCIARHLIERGKFDTDGVRHSTKTAWRALALLQTELEAADAKSPSDNWIRHDGKGIPCPPNSKVAIKFPGDPRIYDNFVASAWNWKWQNALPFYADIIEWKLV